MAFKLGNKPLPGIAREGNVNKKHKFKVERKNWADGSLGEANTEGSIYVDKSVKPGRAKDKKIIDEYKSLNPKPIKTLAFCVGIKHTERMAEKFSEKGIKSRAIHSGNSDVPLSKEKRKNYTKENKKDEIDIA